MTTTARKNRVCQIKIERTSGHVLQEMETLEAVAVPTVEQIAKYRELMAELAKMSS